MLWERTVDAIREYQKDNAHDSEFLFVSYIGAGYVGNHVSRNFRKRRKKAKLPDAIFFEHIRDSAETAAIQGGADITQARLLAGHRCGISDHYIKRNPKMVAEACKLIERHYFPPTKKNSRGK